MIVKGAPHEKTRATGHLRAASSGRNDARATVVIAGIVVGLALFAIQARSLWFTQDDAYISYRYARNAISGMGLVFNPGERVEGYTNFFWVLWLVLAGRLGVDFDLAAKVLGIISAGGMIVLAALITRRVWQAAAGASGHWAGAAAALLVGANGSLAYWSVSGLETAFFGLCVTAAVWWWLERSWLSIVALTLGVMARPEGGLVWLTLAGAEWLIGDGPRRSLVLLGGVLAALLPFGVFKLLYYGSLLPNSFYAKTGVAWEYIAGGLGYGWYFLSQYGLWGVGLLLVGAGVVSLRGRWRAIPILWLIFALYIVAVGGDVLRPHRFFVPMLALYAASVVGGMPVLFRLVRRPALRPLAVAVPTASLLIAGWFVPRPILSSTKQLEAGLVLKMSTLAHSLRNVDSTGFSIAASTIGRIAYELPGHRVIDMLGLTDTAVARHPESIPGNASTWKERHFNATYVLSQDPDYILFSTGYKPSAPAERALILHSKFRRNYYVALFPTPLRELAVYRRKGSFAGADSVWGSIELAHRINAGFNDQLRGLTDSVVTDFAEVLHSGPRDYSLPAAVMASTYMQMGKVDLAIAYADTALAIDSFTVSAWRVRGWICRQRGDSSGVRDAVRYVGRMCPWLVGP